jgi:uncharacterized protein with GYD domain
MALFMVQAAYTPQALAALTKKPEDREQGARALIERAGGKLLSFYYCFGDYDVVGIYEAPDVTAATAISLALSSPGHLKAIKTTPLLTSTEGQEGMRKAGSLTYRGPIG